LVSLGVVPSRGTADADKGREKERGEPSLLGVVLRCI
jgi:hypothetical protein